MRGDLKKDFGKRVQDVAKKTLSNYSVEIGLALGPAKVTLKAIPTRSTANEINRSNDFEEIER